MHSPIQISSEGKRSITGSQDLLGILKNSMLDFFFFLEDNSAIHTSHGRA